MRHYTPFGWPGWPKQAHKREANKSEKKSENLGAGRGGGATTDGERVVPGMCLVTFGLKTEVSLERGAFSGFSEYLLR